MEKAPSDRPVRPNGRPLPTRPGRRKKPELGPSRHNLVRDTDPEPDTN